MSPPLRTTTTTAGTLVGQLPVVVVGVRAKAVGMSVRAREMLCAAVMLSK